MASYQKRTTKKKGTVYDVVFRVMENGKETQKRLSGFRTKKEAEKAYIEYMANPPAQKIAKTPARVTSAKKNNEGVKPKTPAKKDKFKDVYNTYVEARSGVLSSSSIYSLKMGFTKHVLPDFGERDVRLTKQDIVAWQDRMWNKKSDRTGELFSQTSLKHFRNYFMEFMAWASTKYDFENPFTGVKMPHRREQKKEMQIWTPEQFFVFIDAVDTDFYKAFFNLLFFSGCRVGELLALTVDDMTKKDGCYTMKISKSCVHKTVRGGFMITPPKTPSSNRSVKLPKGLTKALDEFLAGREGYIFGGERPITDCAYKTAYKKALAKTNLPHIRIHDFRHSHASMLINKGIPITEVSKRLGHSSVTMTLTVYSHCFESSDTKVASLLNGILTKWKDPQ